MASECHHVESTINVFDQLMRDAANAMDFEKASKLKKQIDQLTKLQNPKYRWTHNLENLSILHVDKSFKQPVEGSKRKTLQYKWLKIVSGNVYDLGDFLPESQAAVNQFLEKNWASAEKISYTCNTKEHLGNIAHFLFRSKRPGFWLDCTDGIDGDKLYSELEELFQTCLPIECAKKETSERQSDA